DARPVPLRRLVAPERRADADPQGEDRPLPVARLLHDRLNAPSSNTCRLLARDHAAPESTLPLAKAASLGRERVRPLAWCSRPRDSAVLLNEAPNRRAELVRDRLRVRGVTRDDEAGVVAGERTDHLRVLDAVERPRDRRGRADFRMDDDDVLRRYRSPAELREHRREGLTRASPASAPRQHVTRPPEHVEGLLEPELADIARDRRLRDFTARFPERALQLVLAPDPTPADDARDQTLPLVLR